MKKRWYPVLLLSSLVQKHFTEIALFCPSCGKEASKESKFCSACGFSLQQSSVPCPSGIGSEAEQPAVKTPIKFQEFLKRKSESRKEHLKPKSTRKVERDVSINIGIVTARGKSHKLNKTLILCWLPSNIEDKTWRSQ